MLQEGRRKRERRERPKTVLALGAFDDIGKKWNEKNHQR